jgi:hypothetical protein
MVQVLAEHRARLIVVPGKYPTSRTTEEAAEVLGATLLLTARDGREGEVDTEVLGT